MNTRRQCSQNRKFERYKVPACRAVERDERAIRYLAAEAAAGGTRLAAAWSAWICLLDEAISGPKLGDTEAVPDHLWLFSFRRVEVVLGLLLTAVSFAPWWTRRVNGSGASVWTGPHFSWLAVLLCLAVVAGRSFPRVGLGDRWAATGLVVALAVAGCGWLSELASDSVSPGDGSHQLAWVLQDQGSDVGPVGGPFDIAWGYPVGLCLMGLLLATFAAAAVLRRTR